MQNQKKANKKEKGAIMKNKENKKERNQSNLLLALCGWKGCENQIECQVKILPRYDDGDIYFPNGIPKGFYKDIEGDGYSHTGLCFNCLVKLLKKGNPTWKIEITLI